MPSLSNQRQVVGRVEADDLAELDIQRAPAHLLEQHAVLAVLGADVVHARLQFVEL
jgi:hypothetical protein